MSSSTVAEPAAYGCRRQNRQDLSGVLGRLCRFRQVSRQNVQNHNDWCLMDVEESLHRVGWRET